MPCEDRVSWQPQLLAKSWTFAFDAWRRSAWHTASEAQKVFEAEMAQGMKELEKQKAELAKKSGSSGRS